MIPILEVPSTIQESLKPYRSAFVREAGFEHIARYLTGLLIFPNKTLQAIHQLQRWPEGQGIYDLKQNKGIINLGTSKDTSEFVTDCIELWWIEHGEHEYPNATEILVLCDGGGSNSSRHYEIVCTNLHLS